MSAKPHRAHDYRHLLQRWRAVARTAGLRLRRCVSADKDPIFFLKTRALGAEGGMYISAAIHGDEPASSEALVTWAEKHAQRLARWPVLIFPCINPWGLRNNIRLDAHGLDLNRSFHIDQNPIIRALKKVTAPHQFDLAVMLHEDYDAQGFYLYEIMRDRPYWGEELLKVVSRHIAVDPRAKIEGRKASGGLIRRRFDLEFFERVGFPEAIWLHQHHARRALTVESPSEFALSERVRAHMAVLDECARRLGFLKTAKKAE